MVYVEAAESKAAVEDVAASDSQSEVVQVDRSGEASSSNAPMASADEQMAIAEYNRGYEDGYGTGYQEGYAESIAHREAELADMEDGCKRTFKPQT